MAIRQGQATLSRQDVVDAALAIVEAEGVEQLTVRRLAQSLSVAVTSIYWHVGDKEALLDAVAERIVERFGEIRVRGSDPLARLQSAAASLRAMLRDQADLVALVNRQGRVPELMLPAQRRLAAELTAAGLQGRELGWAVQVVLQHVVGTVLVGRQVERQPEARRTLEQLWPEAPPEMVEAFADAADEDRRFRYGIEALLTGIMTSSTAPADARPRSQRRSSEGHR